MLKEEDKLVCIRNPRSLINKLLSADIFEGFTNGKVYEIKSVDIGSINCSLPHNMLVVYNDKKGIRFLNDDKLGVFEEILFSVKKIRRMKLKKLKNETIY